MNTALPLWRTCAQPLSMRSGQVQVRLPGVAVDEHCQIRAAVADGRVLAHGIVTHVDHGLATLALVGAPERLEPGIVVVPTGRSLTLCLGEHLLGSVLDGHGTVVERLQGEAPAALETVHAEVASAPLDYRRRRAICVPFATGVRALDALLPVGEGQRLGIFAAAGCGKTSLVEMLLANAGCDVRIVALIGERGREVAGFVDALRNGPEARNTIIVQATSDAPPSTRVNAALVATRLSEFFRDRGRCVLLVMDSATRYARALRDVALSRGEPPARRGYPASVFEALPRLLERPGATERGSVTAFYTVLLEDEAEADPIGEEVKSLLDGHVYLSSRLAQRGHFPAIDVLRSGSRLAGQLSTQSQRASAARVRSLMARLDDLQLLRDIGEYQPGSQPEQDRAVEREPALHAFLQQDMQERVPRPQALEALDALVR
ncbi:FliI/YscN family ATPase [Stenotrophomonas cyclobalanopsidis]|uniref:FliI/YscN family ATPase n=1 Tax=Stenotrophomonas cyclobalanopsidis TaxID=2771362 RepID=UPI0028B10C48|nr:FliI/YscN family ATPase [Stenotrophomonas cyclobalanopsidis]